jgi:hypothetical protein
MVLPLIVSIYRSSMVYGDEMQHLNHTHGANYLILRSSEEYLPEFSELPGLSSELIDGTIYIFIQNPDEIEDTTKKSNYSLMLFNIVQSINGRDGADLIFASFSDEVRLQQQFSMSITLHIVSLVFLVVALLIIRASYGNHLKQFSQDMEVMRSCGATNKQIYAVFLTEFIMVFLLGAAIAVGAASAVMYIIIDKFIGVQGVGALTWLIFHVDAVEFGIIIGEFFVMTAIMSCVFLVSTFNGRKAKSNRYDAAGNKIRRYKSLTIANDARTSLFRLFQQRTRKQIISCYWVSIPSTIIIVFLFTFLVSTTGDLFVPPEHDLNLTISPLYRETLSFGAEDIEAIEKLDGVGKAVARHSLSEFYILSSSLADQPVTYSTYLKRFGDLDASAVKVDGLGKYDIVINANSQNISYEIGDTISIYPMEASVRIAQVFDIPYNGRMLTTYLSDELYGEFALSQPVFMLGIDIESGADSGAVESSIGNLYPKDEFSLVNNIAMHEKTVSSIPGYFALDLTLSGILLLFILIILAVKLGDFISGQRSNMQVLYELGADKSDIKAAYRKLTLKLSLIAVVFSVAVGLASHAFVSISAGMVFQVDIRAVIFQLIVAFLILWAYNYPVRRELENVLKSI